MGITVKQLRLALISPYLSLKITPLQDSLRITTKVNKSKMALKHNELVYMQETYYFGAYAVTNSFFSMNVCLLFLRVGINSSAGASRRVYCRHGIIKLGSKLLGYYGK